jgi:glycosyltransferase involved in cell wall biosynthesis
MSKISIFIPAYNAEKHLASVVARIPVSCWPQIQSVWIVNDGSTDHTAAIIDTLAAGNPKIKKITFERNRGYGAVVKAGLAAIRREGADYAVCLHADGQYPPESILSLIGQALGQELDIVQGSRLAPGTALQGGMPRYKYIAGKILTGMQNRVYGLKLTDYHSGFLCYSRQVLDMVPLEKLSDSFDIDVEIIVSAQARGLKIGEIGIPTRYADEVSHLNPWVYGLRILGVMGKYLKGTYNFHN